MKFTLKLFILISTFKIYILEESITPTSADHKNEPQSLPQNLLVITVATQPTDGYHRFKRSTDFYGLSVLTLGMNQAWTGGDVRNYPGGGQKVNLLRRAIRDIADGDIMLPKSFFPLPRNDDVGNDVTTIEKAKGEDETFLALIKQHEHLHKLVILFTDSYDVIFNGNASEILQDFKASGAGILFSAEPFCWPDQTLADKYPEVHNKNRYLNSGGFIGEFEALGAMLRIDEMTNNANSEEDADDNLSNDIIAASDDDQLFYTKIYLDPETRAHHNIKLDHQNRIFQNLNGLLEDELRFGSVREVNSPAFDYSSNTPSELFSAASIPHLSPNKDQSDLVTIYNAIQKSRPKLIHGNGPSKIKLNYIGNYLPNGWSASDGCLECKERTISLRTKPVSEYPVVFINVNVMMATPFFKETLAKIAKLDYPKDKIHLDIYTQIRHHDKDVSSFLARHSHSYKGHEWTQADHSSDPIDKNVKGEIPEGSSPDPDNSESGGADKEHELYGQPQNTKLVAKARDATLLRFMGNKHKPEYLFVVDSECHLDNVKTLILLIEQNRTILAPMVARPGKMWTNFWGALSPSGYYARSDNYMDIVVYKQQGVFNVPFITSTYIIQRSKVASWLLVKEQPGVEKSSSFMSPYTHRTMDADMAFCQHLRWNGDFMYVTNLHVYGHLVDADYYEINHINNDLYQIFDNPKDWEEAYIHPDWKKQLLPDFKLQEPCPDVYWFPMVTDRFCDELIAEMDSLDAWSGGKHEDSRLAGGYENVPTDDIHMTQVGLERHWLHMLKTYVTPLQVKVYPGYHHDPPEAAMNFVVRYKPTAQAFLRPHHDSSTYTINMALNIPHVDYEGGGVNFIRYNCSVVDTIKGWSFIHPGRLTHYHEGLLITKGTRYIMVSFVDP